MSLIHFSEIEKARSNVDLLQLTIEQIQKDFSFFKIDIQLKTARYPYNDLVKSIVFELNELSNKNQKSTFLNLLYRIDISEKKIFKFKQENPGYTLNEAIAHLIVERELLKVLLRTQYKT